MSAPRNIEREVILQLVEAGVKAPSSHNTQPWCFAPIEDGLAVFADRTRALPINDPCDRELTISCGAAIGHIEIAARHHGYEPTVSVLPDPDNHDLLATVHLVPSSDLLAGDELVAIEARRTSRHRFEPTPVPDLASLSDGIDHTVRLASVESSRRGDLAALVSEGDRAQFSDPRWRRELASWMRARGRGDGIVVAPFVGLITRGVVSMLDVGAWTAKKDHDLVRSAPLLIVVGSERDDPGAWIEVGRQLQRLLVNAAAQGLQAGYLNQPCQVASLRTRLRELVPEGGIPQLVVRIGRSAQKTPPSPRRPLADVVLAR